jgi:predicted DNA-binding protein (MmcQ/YjbR family)
MARKRKSDAVLLELRAFGLSYPEAHTKSPWPGHLDLAVRDKTFAYLSLPGEPFSITCKLPHSNAAALALPSTEPAGYGLGKSGWVAARFADDEMPPIDVLKSWIDESYRAVAPKKLAAQIGAPAASGSKPRKAAAKKRGR